MCVPCVTICNPTNWDLTETYQQIEILSWTKLSKLLVKFNLQNNNNNNKTQENPEESKILSKNLI